jgi:hypothetical protein
MRTKTEKCVQRNEFHIRFFYSKFYIRINRKSSTVADLNNCLTVICLQYNTNYQDNQDIYLKSLKINCELIWTFVFSSSLNKGAQKLKIP